jgi:membrane protein YqaA with SNARE-associated domain
VVQQPPGVTAYVALFLSAFGAATILPLASEVPFVLLVRREGTTFWPVVVATCGNYLGACTTYALARLAIGRFVPDEGRRWRRASAVIARYGPPALLLSWVPVIGDALVAVAGAAKMPFGRFSFWTAIGKLARYGTIGWLALRA